MQIKLNESITINVISIIPKIFNDFFSFLQGGSLRTAFKIWSNRNLSGLILVYTCLQNPTAPVCLNPSFITALRSLYS